MLGIALAAALHLMYGAVFPEFLVEVLDQKDKHLHPPEIKVKIDTIHAMDILVGGTFLVFLACKGLWAIIRKHRRAGSVSPPWCVCASHGGLTPPARRMLTIIRHQDARQAKVEE